MPAAGLVSNFFERITMPIVLESPRLVHLLLFAMPAGPGAAVLAVSSVLIAPADQPNLPTVISNVLLCLNAMLERVPYMESTLRHLRFDLETSSKKLAGIIEFDQPRAMVGRTSKHRAWALLASTFKGAPIVFLEAVGIEFVSAYLISGQFQTGPATALQHFQKDIASDRMDATSLYRLENYVLSHLNRVHFIFKDRSVGLDTQTACFNAQVVASVTAQKSSLRVEQRQAAGRINEMTEAELKSVASVQRNGLESGDAQALQAALAFCVGLPWKLALQVPFFSGIQCPSVIWVNPIEGCIYVDTDRMLQGLSKKQTDRHIPTTLRLVRPLPKLLADLLHSACASNPGIGTIACLYNDSFNTAGQCSLAVTLSQ